jgi:hypothetical protein
MKLHALLLGLCVLCLAPQVAAQEEITAYSAMLDKEVHVTVLKVEKTPMSYQDFCTLLTGTYCGPTSADTAEPAPLLQ